MVRDTAADMSRKMGGLFEVSFEGDCVLLGVVRGLTLWTSEGRLPVMVVRRGADMCLVAGPFVLLDVDESEGSDKHWAYLRLEGLDGRCVRRFRTVELLKRWLDDVRGRLHVAFHGELVV
ncbi:hypothetical protein [Burkholderia cenocepacia]|uniref:hypothetical protein n=1 Tax=Burkholderia cenocepacia TaxID=95486 RepID=UPI00264E706F|nr:hypothetical protein [Burkholderia cenocepacia]MDN7680971.1 hypothetical protein [Burkholderia cenocepacia]